MKLTNTYQIYIKKSVDIVLKGAIIYFIFHFILVDISYLDSISDIATENVQSNDSNIRSNGPDIEHSPGILLKYKNKIRSRILWFFKNKDLGKYKSFKEFEKSSDSNNSIIAEFKYSIRKTFKSPFKDLDKARESAARSRGESNRGNAIITEARLKWQRREQAARLERASKK